VAGPRPARRDRAPERPAQIPDLQFEDGSVYREESKDMAATIKAGKLVEKRGAGQPAA